MEPLRAALGVRQTVRVALDRLRAHGAGAAPVVRAGRVIGVVTRARLEDAVRLGVEDRRLEVIVTPRAPRVGPEAGAARMRAAARGPAEALIVASGRSGPWLHGLVLRDRLARSAAAGPDGAPGRGVTRLLDAAQTAALAHAGRIARALGTEAMLVGGAARDLVMGRAPGDLDLVVTGHAMRFARRLGATLRAEVTTHPRFGTATLRGAAGAVDIATARTERYASPAALPDVRPGTWLEDLLRRDVTINAMAFVLDDRGPAALRDPLGGRADLSRRTLRVMHRLSCVEDPTRAWRLARIAARLGMSMHPESGKAIALALEVDSFAALSASRRWREFVIVTQEDDPVGAFRRLDRAGILTALVPGARWDAPTARAMRRLVKGLKEGPLAEDPGAPAPMIHLALLLSRTSPAVRDHTLRTLGLRGRTARSLIQVRRACAVLRRTLAVDPPPGRVAEACERAGPIPTAILWCAGEPGHRRAIGRYLRRDRNIRTVLDGDAVRALGIAPGPAVGRILRALRAARRDGTVRDAKGERRLALELASRVGRLTGRRGP